MNDDMKARALAAARTHGAESEDFGGLVETLVAFAQSEVQRERERLIRFCEDRTKCLTPLVAACWGVMAREIKNDVEGF